MSVIILLLIASLSVALLFLGAFIWSARGGQFEDDYSPPLRILFEDNPVVDGIGGNPPAATEAIIDPNPSNQ